MDNIQATIADLQRRMQQLAQQQGYLNKQLLEVMEELERLKKESNSTAEPVKAPENVAAVLPPRHLPTPIPPQKKTSHTPAINLEELIGKNLASKAGILVTIIGIFIGAKYAIEHEMVSEWMRIIAGYVCGGLLIGIALRLKKKYEAYSAVLMGGGLSVLYFITYIAYSFYDLLPQWSAFLIMLVLTGVIVYTALVYNRVIIAHLAQVGAYAIPFLLSNNTGRYEVLFAYIAIINAGILVVSFKKYWKSLFRIAFYLTWLIYGGWYVFQYRGDEHFTGALIFLSVYFIMFYATFLAYKLIRKEQYLLNDVIILLGNAFIFYGIGYNILTRNIHTENWQGAFTVVNALIHLGVSQAIRKLKLADRSLYLLLLGLMIVFLAIAVPVQFNGNGVTLLWIAEAVLVFIIGRTRQAAGYEKIGAALAVLGFMSLVQEWVSHYEALVVYNKTWATSPFLNMTFVSGVLVLLSLVTLVYFTYSKKYSSALPGNNIYHLFYAYGVPVLCLVTGYFIFYIEIEGYFRRVALFMSGADGSFGLWKGEVNLFSFAVLLLYSMVYCLVVTLVNQWQLRSKALAMVSLTGAGLLLFTFLMWGLVALNGLSANYYNHEGSGLYFGRWNIGIRYILFGGVMALLAAGRITILQYLPGRQGRTGWTYIALLVVLAILSAEYLHWTGISGAGKQYKLGLSILWGVYALLLIVYGIQKKYKAWRWAAIVLFVITLIKLFIYDLAEAGTITKTISFISLGVILLLVSYLYNRYKNVLFDAEAPAPLAETDENKTREL